MIDGVLTQIHFAVGPCTHPVGISQFQKAELDRHTQPQAASPPRSLTCGMRAIMVGKTSGGHYTCHHLGKPLTESNTAFQGGLKREVSATIEDLKDTGW